MYVVSVIGFVGLGLVIHSALVYALLAVWALMYVVAPFLEEPWLEKAYGEAFVAYRRRCHVFWAWAEVRGQPH